MGEIAVRPIYHCSIRSGLDFTLTLLMLTMVMLMPAPGQDDLHRQGEEGAEVGEGPGGGSERGGQVQEGLQAGRGPQRGRRRQLICIGAMLGCRCALKKHRGGNGPKIAHSRDKSFFSLLW